jgi:hypothetical protein
VHRYDKGAKMDVAKFQSLISKINNMNVKLEALTYKAQRYWLEVAYSLEGINGRCATQKEILDYVLTTLCDIEELVGDPITWIGEQKESND